MYTFKIAMSTDYLLAMANRILGNMATSTDHIWGRQVNKLSHVCGAALALNCVPYEALLYRGMFLSWRKQLTTFRFQYAPILTGLLCCIRIITLPHQKFRLFRARCSCSETFINTRCPRRNGQNFGRVFLMLKCTDITQKTCIQSWTVTEIMAREKCGLLAGPRTVPVSWQVLSMFVLECGVILT
jgi:hypothetical protein